MHCPSCLTGMCTLSSVWPKPVSSRLPFESIHAHSDCVVLAEPFHLQIASWSCLRTFHPKHHCPFLMGPVLFSEMRFLSLLKAQCHAYLFHILLNPQLVLFLCIHIPFSLHLPIFPTSFFLALKKPNKLISKKTLEYTKDTFLIIVHALLFTYIFKVFPPKNNDFIVFIKMMHA